MAVQQAMSIYNQRKADFVNRLVGTMREATNLCNGYAITCFKTCICLFFPIKSCECSNILLKVHASPLTDNKYISVVEQLHTCISLIKVNLESACALLI